MASVARLPLSRPHAQSELCSKATLTARKPIRPRSRNTQHCVSAASGKGFGATPESKDKDESEEKGIQHDMSDKQYMDQLLEEAIKEDPKLAKQLEDLRAAANKVADLKAQRAALEGIMDDASANEANARLSEQKQAQLASERGANQEILDAADDVEAAMKDLEEARKARDEALNQTAPQQPKWEATDINEDAEKVESGKAAVMAAIAGTIAFSPFILSADTWAELGTGVGGALLSCALFGVTYRYAVRSDIANSQLKGGVVGAFGLVRGVAQAEIVLSTQGLSMDSILTSALYAGESMIMFGFAAVALEKAFQSDNLKAFGTAGK